MIERTRSSKATVVFRMLRDAVLAVGCYWLALLLRFDGTIQEPFAGSMLILMPYIAGVLLLIGATRGLYRNVARYASMQEMFRLVEAVGFMGLSTLLLAKFGRADGHLLPLSVPIVGTIITFLVLGAVRLRVRLYEHFLRSREDNGDQERVLIVGAGNAGELLCRDLLRTPGSKYVPVGFLDDDPRKVGMNIHQVPVLGSTRQMSEVVDRYHVGLLLVAMPSASSRQLRPILDMAAACGTKVKLLPSLEELLDRPVTSREIRDVDIADLLGRDPVTIDAEGISEYLAGRVVLVTGAAGSIGSELCRQVLRYQPKSLIMVDHDESDIYALWQQLSSGDFADEAVQMVVGDVRDLSRMQNIFQEFHPAVVFHAAAQKHVPVLERFPSEAIQSNVVGTKNVATLAGTNGCERFVLVSTDKAVDPSSVMGATKRIAELVVQRCNERFATIYASVRFGNVLGSRGSVVPIFAQQIRDGGPVTITHREATRYFMTIPEAASLIIQAGAFAEGGETFILDMGEPVKIVELAERMIQLLADKDEPIALRVVGLRPGERLHETLWRSDERVESSEHPRIRCSPKGETPLDAGFDRRLERLIREPETDAEALRARLSSVPGSSALEVMRSESEAKGQRSRGALPAS